MGDERRSRFPTSARDLPPRGELRSTASAIRERAHRDEQLHQAAQVRSPAQAKNELRDEQIIYTVPISEQYEIRESIGRGQYGWTASLRIFDANGNARSGGLLISPRLLREVINGLELVIEELKEIGALNKNGL